MSLPHAILTSLLEKPASGAELARRFEKSLGYFWSATHQQIYRELARLEEAGLIESSDRESTRGRQRHYSIRGSGRAELEQWSRAQEDPRPVRDALLVRLRAAAALGTVEVAEELRRHIGLHQGQLDTYLAIEHSDFPDGGSAEHPSARLQHAVLAAGIGYERAWLAWARDTLPTLPRDPVRTG
ncbi:PadR family transcriptional regulator [Arthrobacter sp. 35W]|uniref:PadR family transcriptional regulator n=1 Tax=Arthrobacter sp. 35W TaxID=1132441 RepID=UPI0004107FE3|nr:PadR family transcriptional regulator [Arthrobacter sp. 35W]